eukprot:1143043-Pelagomonas_calceolata.AAC.4
MSSVCVCFFWASTAQAAMSKKLRVHVHEHEHACLRRGGRGELAHVQTGSNTGLVPTAVQGLLW